jgi:folate-binding protein YgfZ
VARGIVDQAEREALATRAAVIVRPGLSLFRLTGGGRIACLQGLVTCDLIQPGDDSHVFGALLTAKGMIVSPLWITRVSDALLVEAPAAAATQVATVFERSLPPRLCSWENVTAETSSLGVYGPAAGDILAAATGGEIPSLAERVARLSWGGADAIAARLTARGLDGFDVLAPAPAAAGLVAQLTARGALAVSSALIEERRILGGFPRLGAEITERTIPQEVRLDELGAVSYTKGCYLGQETVARVHFRGHANRFLAGLALEREPAKLPLDIVGPAQAAGSLTSVCWWEAGRRWVGLAVVRRGVKPGSVVALADGSAATVRELPWEAPRPDEAS